MVKNRKNRVGVVYSTNPDFAYSYEEKREQDTLPMEQQNLSVSFDSKRKGRGMTLVEGFQGRDEDRKELGRILKVHCGSGGSLDGDIIMVQGDMRVKLTEKLQELGCRVKRKN